MSIRVRRGPSPTAQGWSEKNVPVETGAFGPLPKGAQIYMRGKQRKADRYGLELPVVFRWGEGRASRKGSGHTRDISIAGAFILSGEGPGIGTVVQFDFLLPSLLASTTPLKLHGMGRVVRVEPANINGTPVGFALANTSFSLSD